MEARKRIFVGIELPPPVKKQIETSLKKLMKKHWKVRWEPKAKWHITLTFVGEMELERIAGLGEELEREVGDFQPFELKLKGLGQFPRPESVRVKGERISGRMAHEVTLPRRKSVVLPKVVWVSLRGELKELHQLREAVLRACHRSQVQVADQGAFVPHITLGRVQPNAGSKELRVMAGEIEKQFDSFSDEGFVVDEVSVIESVLSPAGSQYHRVKEIALGKGVLDAD